jgi:MFS family permease
VLQKAKNIYGEFPKTFWTLIGALFIDRLGGALIFPFLSLYITKKFDVGMTAVGQLFAIWAITGMIGGMIGGAMTDKFGRRAMLIFGLISSATTSLMMGLVNEIQLFYIFAAVSGLFSSVGGPAQGAMVADLLPENQHAQGYGIMRVAANLAVTIGPAIGGLLASINYLWLFIIDASASIITALLVYFVLPETKPEAKAGEAPESTLQTLKGYFKVAKDYLFMIFIFCMMFMTIVYMQMNSSLAVFLRDSHGISEQGFGYILSLNAGMVVVFQFWVSRKIENQKPMFMMALGTLLYAIGFGMYGFVGSYIMFMAAMVIITIGEMIVAPVGQSLIARFAPESMRGRYMAMSDFAWIIPAAIGPWGAGIIMDNYNPNWVWYAGGIIATVAVMGFLLIHPMVSKRFGSTINQAETPPIGVEQFAED